jgi:hypothetical protein
MLSPHTAHRTPLAALLALAFLATPLHALAAAPCSWPVETTGTGASNVAYPDTDATYWTMAFDSTVSSAMRISGQFPAARFMSFTAYDDKGGDATALIDADIVPDPGSSNPFTAAGAGSSGGSYTVTVVGPDGTPGPNTLVLPTASGWVLLRVYVPDEGLDREGGVPLPQVTLIGPGDSETTLPVCESRASAANGGAR